MNEILDKTKELLENNCIITGGHYRIFYDKESYRECLNDGTVRSFLLASKLYRYAKDNKIEVGLGILINDMGSECNEEKCKLERINFSRVNYQLPGVYRKIIEIEKIPMDSIKIYWEKQIRNKSKKDLLKRFKKSSEIFNFETNGLFISDEEQYGKIILTRTSGKDKYGVPACPLIMAGLYNEQAKYYEKSINFYYIGNDNLENIPNYFVIEKGKRVSDLFGIGIKVNNVYFE